LLKRDRAIAVDADCAPGRGCTRCEPRVQDEDNLSGLAAPRRVTIPEIGDAETEAGQAAVEYLDALT